MSRTASSPHAETFRLPCSCGGTLKPTELKDYDATVELGLSIRVTGNVGAFRCTRCHQIALSGQALEEIARLATGELLGVDRRLSGEEARFLRKAAVRVTQPELATLLGVSRPTIARWEADASLTAEHDFELRSLVIGVLLKEGGQSTVARLMELARFVLTGARTKQAPRRAMPLKLFAT